MHSCLYQFRDAEEQAEKIALEIESQPAYKERTDIENGDENEEAKFAAVERPQSSSPDEIKVGKYVAPGRRKQHNTQAGKLIRPSQLSNSNNNSSSSSSVPILSTQQSSNNKYPSLVSHSLPPQQSVQKSTGAYERFYFILTIMIASFKDSLENLIILKKKIVYKQFVLSKYLHCTVHSL